jgi:hypothetical protein
MQTGSGWVRPALGHADEIDTQRCMINGCERKMLTAEFFLRKRCRGAEALGYTSEARLHGLELGKTES